MESPGWRLQRRQLVQALDENEGGVAELHLVAGRQLPFGFQGDAVDSGAVEALEVADAPFAFRHGDFGVFAAAQFILEDDAVGVGPAQREALSGLERKHVAVAIVAAHHEVGTGTRRDHELDGASAAKEGMPLQ
jgi:hypothetical protein